ncbi:hypothetical protein [Sinomonas sp. B1-1]
MDLQRGGCAQPCGHVIALMDEHLA